MPQLASWRLFQCRESIAKITQLSHCVDETEEEFGFCCWQAVNLSFGEVTPVTEQWGGGFTINYYRKDSAFLSLEVPSPHAHLLGSQCPPPEERRLSMPETGEKERNYLFKSYTDLE